MKKEKVNEKIKRWKKDGKIAGQLNKNKDKAKSLLKDKDKIDHFLERLERKLSTIPIGGKYLADIPVLIMLIRAYVNKEYIEIPIGSIIAILSALIYVLSPVDLIPDFIPGVGYLDDAAVIAVAYKLVHDDVVEYKEWKAINEKKLNVHNNAENIFS